VNQGIRDLELAEDRKKSPAAASVPFWRSWLIPIAACAGMVFAFGIGRKTVDPAQPIAAAQSAAPLVYTPEEGVDAEWFASSNAGATVIVLQGVNAIPDSTDFSETVYVPTLRESDRMATRETESDNSATQ